MAAGGKVFFAGGYQYNPTMFVDIYDMATGNWLPAPSLKHVPASQPHRQEARYFLPGDGR